MTNEVIHMLQQENARLRNENRTLSERLLHLRYAIRALNRLDKRLNELTAETDVFGLISSILSSALQAVDSEHGSLLLLDNETSELVFVDVAGATSERLKGLRMPATAGIAGAAVGSKTPWLVPDVRLEPNWSPQVDESIGFETLSLMCVPLLHENQVLGAIEIVNTRTGHPFTEEDLDTLVLVARLASMAIAQAEALGKSG